MSRRRRAIAARYAAGAAPYADHWAPVLVGLARPLLQALPRARDVLDLGCGAGTISGLLPGERVAGVDATHEMIARAPARVRRVVGDIEHLPFVSDHFDLIVSTFVLQHLPRPARAFEQAARVARAGGVLATATWGAASEESGPPYDLATRTLDAYGAGDDPLEGSGWHRYVDAPGKMRRYARRAGFREARAWSEPVEHLWTAEAFAGWATSSGPLGRRFAQLDGRTRLQAADDLRAGLDDLSDEERTWRPEIVCLLATR